MRFIEINNETGMGALWISNVEIEGKLSLKEGDLLFCKMCNTMHQANPSRSGKLLFIDHDDGNSSLIGVKGRYIGDLPIEKIE